MKILVEWWVQSLCRWLLAFYPPPETPTTAELAQAAVDYLGQRYPDWRWESRDETYLDLAVVTGVATIGGRRHAIRLELPRSLRNMKQQHALDVLYNWLDVGAGYQLKKAGMGAAAT